MKKAILSITALHGGGKTTAVNALYAKLQSTYSPDTHHIEIIDKLSGTPKELSKLLLASPHPDLIKTDLPRRLRSVNTKLGGYDAMRKIDMAELYKKMDAIVAGGKNAIFILDRGPFDAVARKQFEMKRVQAFAPISSISLPHEAYSDIDQYTDIVTYGRKAESDILETFFLNVNPGVAAHSVLDRDIKEISIFDTRGYPLPQNEEDKNALLNNLTILGMMEQEVKQNAIRTLESSGVAAHEIITCSGYERDDPEDIVDKIITSSKLLKDM